MYSPKDALIHQSRSPSHFSPTTRALALPRRSPKALSRAGASASGSPSPYGSYGHGGTYDGVTAHFLADIDSLVDIETTLEGAKYEVYNRLHGDVDLRGTEFPLMEAVVKSKGLRALPTGNLTKVIAHAKNTRGELFATLDAEAVGHPGCTILLDAYKQLGAALRSASAAYARIADIRRTVIIPPRHDSDY